MSELRELPDTRQIPGEPRRRWFHSPDLDLIVWFGEDDTPVGFQLCYDKARYERALTWREGRGFDHSAVDTGERGDVRHKSTPILVADGLFDTKSVRDEFIEAAGEVPEDIKSYVSRVLERYPG